MYDKLKIKLGDKHDLRYDTTIDSRCLQSERSSAIQRSKIQMGSNHRTYAQRVFERDKRNYRKNTKGPRMTMTNTNLMAIQETQNLCAALMRTPHYAKIGPEGIFAVVAKAKSLNIDPLDALNGGLYCVQGRVEMSSAMMNMLIRQAGHSVRKDPKSDDTICILHGKRADNGDEWTESFSVDEAKRAGIYNERGPWGKYTRDMLFARSLSRLGRQLFPDVIKGCYVEGELQQLDASQNIQPKPNKISLEEVAEIQSLLDKSPEYKEKSMKFLAESFNIRSLEDLTPQLFQRIRSGALKKLEESQLIVVKNEKAVGE